MSYVIISLTFIVANNWSDSMVSVKISYIAERISSSKITRKVKFEF